MTRARRRERPRSTASKQKTYLKRWICACSPPVKIRATGTDLDITCGRCQQPFIWSPTDSESTDDELAGRVPA